MKSVIRRMILPIACVSVTIGQTAAPQPRLVVVLLGPPGGGKGTQAERITKEFGFSSLSTGEILRGEVKAGTPLGKQIEQTMQAGTLVSDEIVNRLVRERSANLSCYILDGYPRTVPQARFLDGLLAERGYGKPLVVNLDVPEEEIVKRLASRGRADDKPEIIRERLRVYGRDTAPLIEHYSQGDYRRIDGTGSVDEVYERVRSAIRARLGVR